MAWRAPLAPPPPLLDRIAQALRRTPSTRHTLAFRTQVWACLAFGRLVLRDHRGDEHLRLDLPLRHLEAVEVHSPETAESRGDTFSLVLGGGKRHDLRVGDLGTPLRDAEHQAWVRRLRRCAPRIPTNEFADSACPFWNTRRRGKTTGRRRGAGFHAAAGRRAGEGRGPRLLGWGDFGDDRRSGSFISRAAAGSGLLLPLFVSTVQPTAEVRIVVDGWRMAREVGPEAAWRAPCCEVICACAWTSLIDSKLDVARTQ